MQKPTREVLRAWYLDEKQTTAAIAARVGCASQTVQKWLKKYGILARSRGCMAGPIHPGWKGGRTIDKTGYVLIYLPEHPDAGSSGYVREHRLVMEQHIGRRLLPAEVVHHKDGDRQNNAIENLRLFRRNAEHLKHELTGRVPKWTEDGKRRIAEGVSKLRRKWPIAEMLRLHAEGKTAHAIAKLIGASRGCVARVLRRHHIEPHAVTSKFQWPSDARLKELYETNSLTTIGEMIGCRPGDVARRLERLGVARRPRGKAGLGLLRKQQQSKSTHRRRSRRGVQAS